MSKDKWQLTCDGIVISDESCGYQSHSYEDQTPSLLESFKNNILNALADPDWVFIGYGGRMTAQEWLNHHEDNLGVKLSTNLEIHPPGAEFPLCPKLQGWGKPRQRTVVPVQATEKPEDDEDEHTRSKGIYITPITKELIGDARESMCRGWNDDQIIEKALRLMLNKPRD